MSAWPTAALGDIFEIARGGSPRPIDDFITDDPTGINWIMIGDAVEGSKFISTTKKRIRPEGAQRSRRVKPGDFLLTNSMSFGKPYIMRTDGCIHDGWLVLSPRSGNVDANFFYYLLGSTAVYAEFERRASGATVKNLNIDLVRGVTVPFPPLPEQRRIAEILDKADAVRAKRRTSLEYLDTLTQAVFLDALGASARWPISTLSGLCEDGAPITYGILQPGPEIGGGIPYVRPSEIQGGRINIRSLRRTTPEIARRYGKSSLKSGDILVTIVGTIGNVAVVPDELEGANITQSSARVRICSRKADRRFIELFLRSPLAKMQYDKCRLGVAVERLNLHHVRDLEVPLPPMAVQRSVAQLAMVVERVESLQRRALRESDRLFGSLQYRAFHGELQRSAAGELAV